MVIKHGKHYADWRDEKGVRHRRAFQSARSAWKFQRRMQKETQSKKAHASRPSARSRRHGRRAART